MSKKGFTLIELLISVSLLGLAMVFISNFVVSLRNQKSQYDININLGVNQAAISKVINFDTYRYGISNIAAGNSYSNQKIEIILGGGAPEPNRIIEISDDKKTLKYYSTDDNNNIKIVYFARTLTDGKFTNIREVKIDNILNNLLKHIIIEIEPTDDVNNKKYNIDIYSYN